MVGSGEKLKHAQKKELYVPVKIEVILKIFKFSIVPEKEIMLKLWGDQSTFLNTHTHNTHEPADSREWS